MLTDYYLDLAILSVIIDLLPMQQCSFKKHED